MDKESIVSIIVLNYNAGQLLLNCVDSLKKSTYTNLEIIVVDNISSDGSQTKCMEKFPDIKLIQNEKRKYCVCLLGGRSFNFSSQFKFKS